MKIFINAGHGGTDSGAISPTGIKEADITTIVGLMLYNRLILNGYPVEFYQQKESHFEIAPLENKSGATCFISIHCNSFSSKEANGVEVFYCKGSQKGKKLAEITQNELVKATGLRDRKIKEREDLTVLNRTKAPAILVELGFISNKDDLYSLVLQPEIFANAIWEAIKRFNSEKLI